MKQKKSGHSAHIVYIITKLELGGAQKVCLALAEGLHDTIFSTSLISGTQGTLSTQAHTKKNTILLDTFTREISIFNSIKELKLLFHLTKTLRALKKIHPHIIVHTHSTKAGIVGRWAALFAGIKTRIHTIHGYGFHTHQPWIIWIPIYLLELITSLITNHFVCVSSADVKVGIALFPFFAKKHSIIRAAVDTQQFYIPAYSLQSSESKKIFTFGTIACFKPQKNLFDLLHAFEMVYQKNRRVRLEIIGDGIQRSTIERWIAEHQLSHHIILHGWQTTVAPIMKSWNAFVLSSLWEGLPCSVVEARLLHLPVISYDTGGIHDIIFHDQNGLLCDQKDLRSLAKHMLTISKNRQLCQQLSNYKDNLVDFQYAHMIEEHRRLYHTFI